MKLLERLTEVGFDAIDMISGPLRDHVRPDRVNGRLFLSDTIVVDAVRVAISRTQDAELLEMGRAMGGYAFAIRVGKHVYRAEAEVAGIVWKGGLVIVHLRTPAPIDIESRPVLTFLANAVSTLFGGTSLARGIFSYKVPAGTTWDGRDAYIPFDISKTMSLPGWMSRTVPVVLDVTQDSNGLWLKFADEKIQLLELIRFVAMIFRDLRLR